VTSVLLYEFATGGGLLGAGDETALASLRREGAAMLRALAADFAAIAGFQTTVLLAADQCSRHARRDDPHAEREEYTRRSSLNSSLAGCRILPVRSPGEDLEVLERLAPQADWTVVIAPELDGLLEARLEIVVSAGGRLLGPSPELAALAADKQRLAEHLAAAGVPVAEGVSTGPACPLPGDFSYPAVFKPRFGAGSQDVWLIPDAAVARRVRGTLGRPGRLERYYPGLAASVAFLCGPAGRFPLLSCRQRLTADGRFQYLGGSCPLEAAFGGRAERLAAQAVAALPSPVGYIGVDLVLGADPSGTDDRVIEINPRLTTSYVGLRAVCAVNLAEAMIAAAEGRAVRLSWLDRRVEFDRDGMVRASD